MRHAALHRVRPRLQMLVLAASVALGVATLAITGFGFFTWHDDETPEENLADLREDMHIIKTVAAEKKCRLP